MLLFFRRLLPIDQVGRGHDDPDDQEHAGCNCGDKAKGFIAHDQGQDWGAGDQEGREAEGPQWQLSVI